MKRVQGAAPAANGDVFLVEVLFLRDGSMLITDDGANKISRVAYRAK